MGPGRDRAAARATCARASRASPRRPTSVFGGTGEVTPVGVPAGKGFFVGPVVRSAEDPMACDAAQRPRGVRAGHHGRRLRRRRGARGGVRRARRRLPRQLGVLGRPRLGREASSPRRRRGRAGSTSARRRWRRSRPAPGTALPSLLHGGPGRAGGGEELGGERGLELYMQRTRARGRRQRAEVAARQRELTAANESRAYGMVGGRRRIAAGASGSGSSIGSRCTSSRAT